MTYENPTPLRIGATGTLNGWRVTVAGRVVMGMELDGETYTWNEFNLVDSSGNSATLVFEETDSGPEWKLFREFTPSQPLSASEAASKRVGDMVNLDGSPIAVTLVDQSRVCRIEGQAPDGVEFGDVANYFNADSGERMLVASWTGDEIEFYEGLDVPADGVADAFGFSRGTTGTAGARLLGANARPLDHQTPQTSSLFTKIVLIALGAVGLFSARSCFSGLSLPGSSSRPQVRRAAPASAIATGAQGSIGQQHYVVAGQSLMEIARVSGRHERREYWLRGDGNERAVLINGLSGGAKEWHLLRPVTVPAGLTPYDAAALRKGTSFKAGDRSLTLTDLFRSKMLTIDPVGADADAVRPSALEYGFVAGGGSQGVTLARWTEQRIQLMAGATIPEAEVLTAFGRPPVKGK